MALPFIVIGSGAILLDIKKRVHRMFLGECFKAASGDNFNLKILRKFFYLLELMYFLCAEIEHIASGIYY